MFIWTVQCIIVSQFCTKSQAGGSDFKERCRFITALVGLAIDLGHDNDTHTAVIYAEILE